ncbi:MAG: endo-1,4-beta-xylanase, partial [Treponema sp.]|nr:endo-1,4-beta-xylanase [Treponema sp.]
VTFKTLGQNGSASAQTTALTLTFDADITGLAASNITLSAGTTGAVKGALTKTATGVYNLAVSNVTTEGTVSVSVSKNGYTIAENPQTVTVYPLPLPDYVTVTSWKGLTVPSGTTALQYNIAQQGKTGVLKVLPKSGKYDYSVLEYNLTEYYGKSTTIEISFDIWLETSGKVAWQVSQTGFPVVCGSTSTTLTSGQWHTVTGSATVTPSGALYLSSQQLGDTVVAYIANFEITINGQPTTPDPDIPLLFTTWPFMVGAAAPTSAFTTTNGQYALLKHFEVLVAENDMKPNSVMPANKPATFPGAYRWTNADILVNYAKANGKKIRGHVLVWHSQTPDYLFDVSGGTTTMQKEALYDRMAKHIETVFKKYRGDVLWWDVCNEVVGDDNVIRDSWYKKIMENSGLAGINRYEFVLKAFQFAREYADANGGQDVKMYLTDYNIEYPGAKQNEFEALVNYLITNNAPIDGVGFQTHISYNSPTVANISSAIDKFSAKQRNDGKKLMVQITELDMSLFNYSPDNSGPGLIATLADNVRDTRLALQAARYRDLFDMFKQKYEEEKLDMVLVWGLDDGHSWQNGRWISGRIDYPLLFDRQYKPKEAFYKLVE